MTYDQQYYLVGECQLRRIESGHIIDTVKRIRSQRVSLESMVESGAISQREFDILKEKIV